MNKKLTLFEASCIITGYGIGSGVLAMPYLAAKCGLPLALLIIALSFSLSYLLHLMIADLALKSGGNSQIVEIIISYLPQGKVSRVLKTVLFSILALVLYTNLAVYISGAGEILCDLLVLPLWASKLLFYVFAAFVAMFGLKLLGICEKYAMYAIYAVVLSLIVGSLFHMKVAPGLTLDTLKSLLSFFSVAMFSFVAFFSVPQVVCGLVGDRKKIKKAIVMGMAMNAVLIISVILFSQISSEELTAIVMLGWSKSLGLWATVLGSAFTILAMLTTYWSISMALKDIVLESIKVNAKLAFVIASIPSLVISFIPSASFLSFLELAAGAIAILIAIFLIPVFHKSRKVGVSLLGPFANTCTELIVFAAYLLMAAGSVL